MINSHVGTNTLYHEIECPKCQKPIRSGIGFRAGVIRQLTYHVGERLKWDGTRCCPEKRPAAGNIKTIGYFNCDNPRCETWKDCFPEVQEALITITGDVISDVQVITFKPHEQTFDIVDQD